MFLCVIPSEFSHCRHVANCLLTNNIYVQCVGLGVVMIYRCTKFHRSRYVYDIRPYLVSQSCVC
jgi:hypothetical protein